MRASLPRLKNKPQPMTEGFDRAYFGTLLKPGWEKLSAKAFLATEQRIPGLGNGVLQDILFNAGINPKRKMGTLTETEIDGLWVNYRYLSGNDPPWRQGHKA